MSEDDYRPKIAGVPNWRRPPWACPACLELLPIEFQPREGLEAYGVRCPSCSASIRFVRESVRGEVEGRSGTAIWVPALSTDRFSRTAPRPLMEPNPMDWCPGGTPGGNPNTADPTAAFCTYPQSHESLKIERRWKKKLGNDALVSVTAVFGEVWVLSSEGALHVLRPPPGEDLASQSPSEAVAVGGSPLRLGLKVVHPPAHSGGWWFVVGAKNEAALVERSNRTPDDVTTWTRYRCEIPRTSQWAGWPIAVVGRSRPTFAVLIHADNGDKQLAVFEVPETGPGPENVVSPLAVLDLPRCTSVPVQLPLSAAVRADTKEAEEGPDAWLLGALVWTDAFGSLHGISTHNAVPADWCSVPLADEQGEISRTRAETGSGPPGRLRPTPPPPGTGRQLPPPPVAGRSLPPPPGGPPPPPAPGRPLPPPPASGRPLPPPPGGTPPPPVPGGSAVPSGPARYKSYLQDPLVVTTGPFANSGQTLLPGIRVWSVVRPRLHGAPTVRNIAVLGGTQNRARQTWETLQGGACLDSLAAQDSGASAWVCLPPVLPSPVSNDLGRQQEPFITPLVIANPTDFSVYSHANRMHEREVQRSSVDRMPLACQPIVTPIGVFAVFRRRLEVWTLEEDGTSHVATYPAQSDHAASPDDDGYHSLVVQEYAKHPVSPAVIGNNVWIPSESGVVYCLSVRPSSECS